MQEEKLQNATFLQRFDLLKNSLRLSDEKAAERLGLSRQTIFKIRKGLQNATRKVMVRLEIAEAEAGLSPNLGKTAVPAFQALEKEKLRQLVHQMETLLHEAKKLLNEK